MVMNRESFLDLVKNPDQLGPEHVEGLHSFVSEFPYFSSAHMLYSLALHRSKSIQYDKALKTTAIHAGDRRVLYELIMQPGLQEKIQSVEELLEETATGESVEDHPVLVEGTSEVVEEIAPEEAWEKAVESTFEEATGEQSKVVVEIAQAEAIGETPETVGKSTLEETVEEQPEVLSLPVEGTTEAEKSDSIPELEKLILTEAINISLTQELETQVEQEASSESIAPPTIDPPVIEVEATTLSETTDRSGKRSFSSWMQILGSETRPSVEETSKKHTEPTEKQTTQSSLIDRFMNSESTIEPPKSEFFSPANMARMSLTDDESFVTETLANIYAKQGHTQKAINAFQSLRLRNPEKSSYFASRIKELEKLLKKK